VRAARAQATVALAPQEAVALWTDLQRWPSFVEGFGHVESVDPGWPEEGSKLVWRSGPAGRGQVTERVLKSRPGRFATQVFEEALSGTQSLSIEPLDEGARAELALEYELTRTGPFSAIADLIFIRRALRDALRRTLRRFAVEAEEQAGLR
jgi:Polyketide cyclase / dehydrase and lipid transport